MAKVTFSSPQELIRRIEETFIKPGWGPLIQEIIDGKATRGQLQLFCKQFWAIPKYNLAVCGGKISQLQPLPDDPYGMGEPYDLEVVKHFCHILIDEAGTEVFPNHSPSRGHYELYLRFAEGLGIPRKEMERVDIFLPKVVVALHSWVDMARNLPLIESAIGMNWINETKSSRIGIALEPALRNRYGLTKEATEFWYAHGEQDKEHSTIGPYLIEKYVTTPELQERVWLAAKRGSAIIPTVMEAVSERWEAAR